MTNASLEQSLHIQWSKQRIQYHKGIENSFISEVRYEIASALDIRGCQIEYSLHVIREGPMERREKSP